MHHRSLLCALLTAAVTLPFAGFASAGDPIEWPELPYDPCYRVERVLQPSDVCPQGGTSIAGFAINDHGTIVGTAKCTITGPTRAFIWRLNGSFEWILLSQNTTQSYAWHINNDGWVAGRFHDSALGSRAYFWNEQTGELHVIVPPEGFVDVRPTGINAKGVIVGELWPPVQPPSQPVVGFIWEGGMMTLLRDQYDFGGRSHMPTDIDDDGSIAGYFHGGQPGLLGGRPFVIKNGQLFEIDDPYPGGWQGVSGGMFLPGGRFVAQGWEHPDIEFGSGIVFGDEKGYVGHIPNPPPYSRVSPLRTNHAGDIVGHVQGSFGNRAMITRGKTIHELRHMVLGRTSMNAANARGISGNGQIAAGPFHLVPAPPPLADLNGNCRRDIEDLLLLLRQWGPGENNSADLNGDGRVDLDDLLILLNLIAEDISY